MRVLLLAAAVALSGCAIKNTMHVNPASGEIRNCAASGWGWMGTPMALAMHGSCEDSLRSIGFIPMANVEPAKLTIDSVPTGAQIFAGPTEQELKPIGKAPMNLVHPMRSRTWLAECYQARQDGAGVSAVDCRPKEWGDRAVLLKLPN